MEMFPLDSGTVRAVDYEPETEALHVELTSGALYQFMEVPQPIYDAFIAAPSKDEYLENVLKRNHRFVELT